MTTDWNPDLFIVDKDSSVPIYAQIVNRVEALVMSGKIKAGDRLPSIRSVAEATRVDYNTVAKAYADLDRAGVIKTARGIGTHVTGVLDEAALQASRQAKLHDVLGSTIQGLLELGYSEQEIRETFEVLW
ncbi:MAG: GntR family transcriptional regulator [Anaerolineae bacterium]|nr:GntR family transcriptional regulator [Anaerolineae bacterium]